MRRTLHKLAFAAAVVGAMGFGGTQAFAAPAAAGAAERSCTFTTCRNYCRNEWCTPGLACYGYCDPELGCVCEYV